MSETGRPQDNTRRVLDALQAWVGAYAEARDARWLPSADDSSQPRQSARLREIQQRGDARFDELVGPVQVVVEELVAAVRVEKAKAEPDRHVEALRKAGETALAEFIGLVLSHTEDLLKLFPNNPVGVLQTVGETPDAVRRMFRPDRLYLDVTDATINDVKEVWALVEWEQAALQRQGLSQKKTRGARSGPRSPDVRHWVERARQVGEEAARKEFLAEGGSHRGEHVLRAQRWRTTIRPHLRA